MFVFLKIFKKNTKDKRAFTLIELLVVIAIIGLLASIVLVSVNNARKKARDAKTMNDLKQFQTALELCYDKQGSYLISGEEALTMPCGRESFSDNDFRNGWQTKCGEFIQLPNEDYVIHTTGDYQHYVLLGKLEPNNKYVMTVVNVANFVDLVGISDWEPCSSYNYIIGH